MAAERSDAASLDAIYRAVTALTVAQRRAATRENIGSFDLLQGLPGWAKLAFFWGPMTVMLSFLIYIGAMNIPAMRLEYVAIKEQNVTIIRQQNDILEEIKVGTAISRQICAGLAKTEDDRRECMQYRRNP